ncbi:hypothetical protein LCGC14_0725650 [marine sediment metagenome]|uniref:Uncharacterized protein n=1 Tax=marine sediment metagenome TaxID=412755 RepID=A0A0F9QFB7_9ZZZZ
MATEPIKQETVPADGTPPQPDPQPITQEQLDQKVAEVTKQHEEKLQQERDLYKNRETQLISSLNNQNTQQQPPPAAPTVTKEEALRYMQDEGDPSKVMEYYDNRMDAQAKSYEDKITNLQQLGGSQISSLAIQQAEANPSNTHFSRYKAEIMEVVNRSGSSDPAMVQEAYVYVRGKHMDEILKEEQEKMLRQAEDNGGVLVPGGGKTGRGKPMDEGPKPEEVYSDRAQSLLEQKNIDADQFLKKVGSSMPFRDYEAKEDGTLKSKRVKRFEGGFKDLQKVEEENKKMEEEFEWYN